MFEIVRSCGDTERVVHVLKSSGDRVSIGRDKKTCGIVLPADSDGVSRLHATLFIKQDKLYLEDKSQYGTSIDGAQCLKTTKLLDAGSTLLVGTAVFIVKTFKSVNDALAVGSIETGMRLPGNNLKHSSQQSLNATRENLQGTQNSGRSQRINASNSSQMQTSSFFAPRVKADKRPDILVPDTPDSVARNYGVQNSFPSCVVTDSLNTSHNSISRLPKRELAESDDFDFAMPAAKSARSKKSMLFSSKPKSGLGRAATTTGKSILAQDTMLMEPMHEEKSRLPQTNASTLVVPETMEMWSDDEEVENTEDTEIKPRKEAIMDLNDVHSQMQLPRPIFSSTQMPAGLVGRKRAPDAFVHAADPSFREPLEFSNRNDVTAPPPPKRRGRPPKNSFSIGMPVNVAATPQTNKSQKRIRVPAKVEHVDVEENALNGSSFEGNSILDVLCTGKFSFDDTASAAQQKTESSILDDVTINLSKIIVVKNLERLPTQLMGNTMRSNCTTVSSGRNVKKFKKACQGRFNTHRAMGGRMIAGVAQLTDFRNVRE